MGEKEPTEHAIKQVGDRYYPVIMDREAGGHYEIKTHSPAACSTTRPPRRRRPTCRAREKGG